MSPKFPHLTQKTTFSVSKSPLVLAPLPKFSPSDNWTKLTLKIREKGQKTPNRSKTGF